MPAESVINRVGRFEFFPVVVPGFYILVSLSYAGLKLAQGDNHSIWDSLPRVSSDGQAWIASALGWFIPLLVILASYLFGHVVRAIRVQTADQLTSAVMARVHRDKHKYRSSTDENPYSGEWPYVQQLSVIIKRLKESKVEAANRFKIPAGKASHVYINFFKLVVCEKSPNAFEVTQSLEARSRLFAGMFWAGIIGGIFSLPLALLGHAGSIIMTGVSLALIFCFGANLRRVRLLEAENLLLAYLGMLYKESVHDLSDSQSETPST